MKHGKHEKHATLDMERDTWKRNKTKHLIDGQTSSIKLNIYNNKKQIYLFLELAPISGEKGATLFFLNVCINHRLISTRPLVADHLAASRASWRRDKTDLCNAKQG